MIVGSTENDGKFFDMLHEPLSVGDTVMCGSSGQGDWKLKEREILAINENGYVKLKGMQRNRRPDEVMSTKPHKEKYPEHYV